MVISEEKKREAQRQAKFQELVTERGRILPNESYEDSFAAVAISNEGEALLSQMHVANSDEPGATQQATDAYDPQLHADSRQKFLDLVDRMGVSGEFPGWDHARRWMHASGVHPEGKRLFSTWHRQAQLQKQQELAKQQKARAPHLYR